MTKPMEGFEDELNALVQDMFREDPLGAVVRMHLRFENLLSRWLDVVVPHPEHAKRLAKTFSGKVDLALSLGLHNRLAQPLRRINKLRNDFAHELDTRIDQKVVAEIYASFNAEDKQVLHGMFSNMKPEFPAEVGDITFTALDPVDQFRMTSAALWAILRLTLANRIYAQQNQKQEAKLRNLECE